MHIPGVATLMYSVFEYNWNLKLINLVVVEGENQRSWQKTLTERTRINITMYDAEPRTQTQQDTLVRSVCPAVTTVSTCPSKVPLKTSLIHAFTGITQKLIACVAIVCLSEVS